MCRTIDQPEHYSVNDSSTVQCASEIVTSDDDTRNMEYYTH